MAIAPCASSPCQNGFTCSNTQTGPSYYDCNCGVNGYSGQNCETCTYFTQPIFVLFKINKSWTNLTKKFKAPCDSDPCQNGGTCFNYNNATSPYYRCDCVNGYTGQNCETRKYRISYLIVAAL